MITNKTTSLAATDDSLASSRQKPSSHNNNNNNKLAKLRAHARTIVKRASTNTNVRGFYRTHKPRNWRIRSSYKLGGQSELA